MDLTILDIGLRGACTALALLLTALFWLSRIHRYAVWAMTLLTLTTVARIWSGLPPQVQMPDHATQILRAIAAFAPVSSTFFILTIFLDTKRTAALWLGSALLIAIGTVIAADYRPIVLPLRGYAVLHFCALLALTLGAARDDLIEARRRVRPILAAVLILFFVVQAFIARPNFGPANNAEALISMTGILLCLIAFALWVLTANEERWPGAIERTPTDQPNPVQIHAAQAALIARIKDAMAEGIWRREGLTVSALAAEVDAPEHRVRKAINQSLGHRNFASFINSARIDAAKRRLSDPADADTTVLEIAYDVGFASLGPFNRAFRAATGSTPTAFRQGKIGAPLADPENTAPKLKTTG